MIFFYKHTVQIQFVTFMIDECVDISDLYHTYLHKMITVHVQITLNQQKSHQQEEWVTPAFQIS